MSLASEHSGNTARPDLSEPDLAVLRAAVSFARERQIQSVEALKIGLCSMGFVADEVDRAIGFWANNLRKSQLAH